KNVTCWGPPLPPSYGPGSRPFGLLLARRRTYAGCTPPVNSFDKARDETSCEHAGGWGFLTLREAVARTSIPLTGALQGNKMRPSRPSNGWPAGRGGKPSTDPAIRASSEGRVRWAYAGLEVPS